MPTFFSQLNYWNTKIKHITWTFISLLSPLGIVVQVYCSFSFELMSTDTHVGNGGERKIFFLFWLWWCWCWCWGGQLFNHPPPRCYTNWSYSLKFYILTKTSTCSCSGVQGRIIYKIVKNIIPRNLFLSKIYVRIFSLFSP